MNTDENEKIELNVPDSCPSAETVHFTECHLMNPGGVISVTRRRL